MSASSSFALANVPSRPNCSPLCLLNVYMYIYMYIYSLCYIIAVVVHFCENIEFLVDLFISARMLVPQYYAPAAP
jgi:hypothetical protein